MDVNWLIRFGILVAAFGLMPIIPGVRVQSFFSALAAAAVFTFINFVLGHFISRVLVIGTLGLALFAINFFTNFVMLWITDRLLGGLEIRSFWAHILATGLLTAANYVSMHLVTKSVYI